MSSIKVNNIKHHLGIVNLFNKDIGMTFGVDKCVYYIKKKVKLSNLDHEPSTTSPFNQWLQVIIEDIWELMKTSVTSDP